MMLVDAVPFHTHQTTILKADAQSGMEPAIGEQIMELHHAKHHQRYVTNLNAALKSQAQAMSDMDVPQQVANLQAIKFNGGGHINHSLF